MTSGRFGANLASIRLTKGIGVANFNLELKTPVVDRYQGCWSCGKVRLVQSCNFHKFKVVKFTSFGTPELQKIRQNPSGELGVKLLLRCTPSHLTKISTTCLLYKILKMVKLVLSDIGIPNCWWLDRPSGFVRHRICCLFCCWINHNGYLRNYTMRLLPGTSVPLGACFPDLSKKVWYICWLVCWFKELTNQIGARSKDC